MQSDKIRTGIRMPVQHANIIEGTVSVQYHDGREPAWGLVGMTAEELRELSEDLADLAYRVDAANRAISTPMPVQAALRPDGERRGGE